MKKTWLLVVACLILVSCGVSCSKQNEQRPKKPVALPDFKIKTHLTDSAGNPKTVFSPGETMRVHIKILKVDHFKGITSSKYSGNTIPVYHLYNPSEKSNVFTTSVAERDAAISAGVYVYKGIVRQLWYSF